MYAAISDGILHKVPVTPEQVSEQNYRRGQLWGLELLLEFEQEMKDWKEQHK